MTTSESLPTDLAATHAMILAERAARLQAEAVAASAKAEAANAKAAEALISYLKLEIEKLRRQIYGSRSERKARLLEQMELQLEELEATATEDELAAERAAAQTQTVKSFQRKRPSRKPLPDHLPRERVVIAAPESYPCCGSSKLSKLGEDITETLEVIPRQWKVIRTVRERFSCRDCETIPLGIGRIHHREHLVAHRVGARIDIQVNDRRAGPQAEPVGQHLVHDHPGPRRRFGVFPRRGPIGQVWRCKPGDVERKTLRPREIGDRPRTEQDTRGSERGRPSRHRSHRSALSPARRSPLSWLLG